MKTNMRITYEILKKLRISRCSVAYPYMMSTMELVFQCPDCLRHITNDVYTDVAKKHHNTCFNVERGMRALVERAWKSPYRNEELIVEIFGEESLEHRPTNTEFFRKLYEYICDLQGEPVQ